MKNENEGEQMLARYELCLQAALRPVSPRAQFVDGLRSKLAEPISEPKSKPGPLQYTLWTVAGILSSILLVATGIRATKALMAGMKNVKQQVAGPVQTEANLPLTQAT